MKKQKTKNNSIAELEIAEWIVDSIDSCEKQIQLESCKNLIKNYHKIYNNDIVYIFLHDYIKIRSEKIVKIT